MAYANYQNLTFSDKGTDPGTWAKSTGTDGSALIDDPSGSEDDATYISTSTDNAQFHFELDTGVTIQEYEVIRITYRARRVGGTTAYIDSHIEPLDTRVDTVDLTTSWANYTIAQSLPRSENGLAINLDGTRDSNYFWWRLKARVTGGAAVQVSNIIIERMPTADHAVLIPTSDGSTENWTLSTGTDSFAVIDNFGIATSDWTGQNSSTTDSMSTSSDAQVTEVNITDPTFTDLGAGDVVAVIWYAVGSASISNPVQIDLIESGTSFTTPHHGAGSARETNGDTEVDVTTSSRFNVEALTLDSAPTNWNNVQLRITSTTLSSNTVTIYSMGVIGPFNYAAATNYDVSITEAITVGDTHAAIAAALGSFAESITVGDTQSGLAGSFGTFAEGITVGDAQSALAAALGSVSEAVLLTDLFTGVQTYLVSISEGITVGDTQSAVASALAALSESITVGDTQTALAGALAALSEGVVTGDTQSGLATALAILAAENVNLNEVITSLQVFLAYMTESITVGDSTSAQAAVLAAFTESLAAGDAPSATATALAALSEGITNAEVFAAVAAAYASVNEGILVGETWSYPLIGAHLVGTFSIEPLLAASPSNQALLAATVTTEGLEGTTITINR